MGRWFVTGDCHGRFGKILNFADKMDLGELDNIIILGDVGLFWRKDGSDAKSFLNFFERNYKCHIWWIDGNHENFDLIEQIPINRQDGIGYISEHIHYIPRGTEMEINKYKCLFLRGCRFT